ncbi:tryptophan--tRNA ligase, partial [Arthrospira platensis SPKY1]|nr:tryptophan--tRNA ligase [Arthrospira platensis SPKY1]
MPDVFIPKAAARVKSLQDPERKMSKSDPNTAGCIYLLDKPEVIRKKVMSAVTDSGTTIEIRDDKPGISNLLTLLAVASGRPVEAWQQELAGKSYGEFKPLVADALIALLKPIQDRYQEI